MADSTSIFEIQVLISGIRYSLDVEGAEDVPLNKSVSDITDITAVNGAWSNTIKLPWTKRNQAAFDQKQDPASNSAFNPNELNRAWIIVNSIVQQEGNFIMKEIVINHKKGERYFTIDVVGDTMDLYSQLGEKEIDNIRGLTAYNHAYTVAKMTHAQSATSSYLIGYDYPMIDYGYDWTIPALSGIGAGNFGARHAQFKPAMYVRPVWDAMFKEEGYKWTSNSLTQSTLFDKYILPFTGKEMVHDDTYVQERVFRAGMNTSQNITLPYAYPANVSNSYSPTTIFTNGGLPWPWQQNWWPSWYANSYATTQTVQLNNETTPNGDPNNVWNTTLYRYTNTTAYPITQKFFFQFNIDQKRLWCINDQNGQIITPSIQLRRNGAPIQTSDTWVNNTFVPVYEGCNHWVRTADKLLGQDAFENFTGKWKSPAHVIQPGETVDVVYTYKIAGNFIAAFPAGHVVATINAISGSDPVTYIWNEPDKIIYPGELIQVADILPKKFKRKDLLMAIIKMHNLIVEADPENPKTLKIETRDYYYGSGQVEAWDDKIVRSVPYTEKILGDTSKNRLIFKYKDDKDYFNNDYKNRKQLTYGTEIFNSGNKNVKGDKTIEIQFSPTPIVTVPFATGLGTQVSSTITIPKIGTVNGNTFTGAAANARILIRKPRVPCGDQIYIEGHGWVNYYPYAGHLDDPNNPTVDIDFGQVAGFYYPQTNTTGHNLFNAHWRKMVEEIYDRDSLIITAQVNLSPTDFANFKFNKKVYIDFYGTGPLYYRVNKISGYNPVRKQSCTVEFIKAKDITIPRKPLTGRALLNSYISGTIKYNGSGNGGSQQSGKAAPGSSGEGLIIGEGSFSIGNGIVFGASSSSVGLNNFIFGDNSYSSSDFSTIIGSDSSIGFGSTGSMVLGDNSFIGSFIENSKIIGDNSKLLIGLNGATPSNTIIIGNNITSTESGAVIIGGKLVQTFGLVDAGQDEILNPFNDVNYTVIDGSQDAIRNLGGESNISWLDCGQDQI